MMAGRASHYRVIRYGVDADEHAGLGEASPNCLIDSSIRVLCSTEEKARSAHHHLIIAYIRVADSCLG